MRIICETCGAKYSVADDKIAGKAFKIRCKKCQEPIFLSGAVSTEASELVPGSIWHVVIDGEQQGPLTCDQVEQLATAGQVDGETYCWCDGFEDWMHLRDIEILGTFVASEPADPVESQEAPNLAHEPKEQLEIMLPETTSDMTGTRNESSVLFSIASLQALSQNSIKRPSLSETSAGSICNESGESSGLIDIRALAAANFVSPKSEANVPVDDLLDIGVLPLAHSAPLLQTKTPGSSRRVYSAIIATGASVAVALAAAIVAIVIMTEQPTEAASATAVTTEALLNEQSASVLVTTTSQTSAVNEVTTSSDTAVSEPERIEPEHHDHGRDNVSATTTSTTSRARHQKRNHPRTGRDDRERANRSSPEESREASRPNPSPGLQKLIGDAIDDTPTRPESTDHTRQNDAEKAQRPAKGVSNRPQTLSRSQVRSGMNTVAGRARRCGRGERGTVLVNIVINGPTGRVSSATVRGSFAGTPVGSCVARAVRGARFPPFQQSRLTVAYPFLVQ